MPKISSILAASNESALRLCLEATLYRPTYSDSFLCLTQPTQVQSFPVSSPPLDRHTVFYARSAFSFAILTIWTPIIIRTYELTLRQQPMQALLCKDVEKSEHWLIDPTPVVRLRILNSKSEDIAKYSPYIRDYTHAGNQEQHGEPIARPCGTSAAQNPFYILQARLVRGEPEHDPHFIDDGLTEFLTGTPVSSLYHRKDTDNTEAAYFVFPDLGVRIKGRHKLKMTLFAIIGQEVCYCSSIYTSTFIVIPAKQLPVLYHRISFMRPGQPGTKVKSRRKCQDHFQGSKTLPSHRSSV
ncbi:velvet factor-domain-containing protein [Naematelia encephala]|uniref:Velvet factor-domain-containing protein n=1 Tax=Naematelia encephala TaxID=71784 RepID=A0A1Y2AZ28_9TREE|nr:velvet factor-domain-containing protein [Naematelia encephala]